MALRVGFVIALIVPLAGCNMQSAGDAETATAVAIPTAPDTQANRQLASVLRAKSARGAASGTALLAIVEKSLQSDPSLIAARTAQTNSRASLERTRDWIRPEATTSAQELGGSVAVADLRVTQPLYEFGKRGARIAQAQQQVAVQTFKYQKSQSALTFDIMKAALDVTEAQAEIELNQRRITAFQNALDQADQLSALNLISQSDRQLAQVRLGQSEKDLRSAKVRLTQATSTWQRYAGTGTMPPQASIAGDLLRRFGLASLDAALQQVGKNNLSVREIELEKQILLRSIELQARQGYPTLNAQGTHRAGNIDGRRTQLGITLDFTLYSRNDRDALEDAKGDLAVKDAEIEEAQRQAGFKMRELWQSMTGSRDVAALEDQSVASLRTRAQNLEEQLGSGLIPFSDVVSAQTELYSTEASALKSRFNAERAALDLLVLSGVITAQ